MPASINNYSTTEPIRPLVANIRYQTLAEPICSSTVLTWHQLLGLNNRIHKLLNEFAHLTNNWDEDEALAPNEKVIQEAKFIATLLEKHGQPIFHAAPGPNGEIMLDIRNTKKSKSLEIVFYPKRSIVVAFPENGKPSQEAFEINQLPSLLEWLNQK